MSRRRPRKEAEAWRVISGLAVSCAGAVDPAVEGRNTMVNAERLLFRGVSAEALRSGGPGGAIKRAAAGGRQWAAR